MGLYPMYSGRPELSVSVPMLPSFVIQRDNGATITITTHGPSNGTLQKLLVNGKPYTSALLPVSTILDVPSATLDFFLS
jgi:putative alpha-1,2-mannosidase